jgi:ribosomal protein S18 acetylase RimI-like enzyme
MIATGISLLQSPDDIAVPKVTMIIRQALITDAASIAVVQVETWRAAYAGIVSHAYLTALDPEQSAQDWRERITEPHTDTFVASSSTGLYGFINSGQIRDTCMITDMGFDAEIHTLYVAPRSQSVGVGKALIHEAARHLQERGLIKPVVWALSENPCTKFYERLGAKWIAEKTITIGDQRLSDSAFGWERIELLIAASAPC